MKKILLTLSVLSLFFFVGLQAQPVNQTFNATGTYTIPAGYTAQIKIEAWGGGGGGNNGGGEEGGGGGGAYASSTLTLSAGTYAVTVGSGGAAGIDGGDSSFESLVIALGGESGSSNNGSAGGSGAGSTGDITWSGGNGGNRAQSGGDDAGGGGGGSATATGNGGNGGNAVGDTGGTGGIGEGAGGRGGDSDGTPAATAGTAPGGGGGGKGDNDTSQPGASGRVVVTVICYTSPSDVPCDGSFSTSGTYDFSVPTGYTLNITVQAWGGGGGGGANNTPFGSGGGGGGAYASSTFDLPAGSYTFTVGAGGAAGSPGEPSSFESIVIAAGGGSVATAIGNPATGGTGGAAGSSTGDITFSGGDGGAGGTLGNSPRGGGGGGGSATAAAAGGNGSAPQDGFQNDGGPGGIGQGDGGDGGFDDNNPNAENGFSPGGGGGGKGTNGTSGVGAPGQIIITINTILPVQLVSFTGERQGNVIELKWRTANETNNDYMAIERADNALQFQEIGRVIGVGTTTEIQDYSFTDDSPLEGANYYRLRQVDFDGRMEYHKVIYVDFIDPSVSNSLRVYPNPASERMRVTWATGTNARTMLQVFNSAGQLVGTYQVDGDNGTYELPLQQLPSGVYMLQLTQGNKREVIRFMKK